MIDAVVAKSMGYPFGRLWKRCGHLLNAVEKFLGRDSEFTGAGFPLPFADTPQAVFRPNFHRECGCARLDLLGIGK